MSWIRTAVIRLASWEGQVSQGTRDHRKTQNVHKS